MHEQPVSRLEDVQRHEHLGEQHGPEGEEGQTFTHVLKGTLHGVPITLVLHGELRQFSGGRRTLTIAAGPATVADLLRASDIPLGASAALIVNGEQRGADAPVLDGDTVEVLPAISGGAA